MPEEPTLPVAGQPAHLDEQILKPEVLKAYKEIESDLPQKVFTYLKEREELKLRQLDIQYQYSIQKTLVTHKVIQGYLSIFAGLIAALAVLYLGFIFLKNNQATQGASIVIAVTIGLAGVFVLRKYKPVQEEKEE